MFKYPGKDPETSNKVIIRQDSGLWVSSFRRTKQEVFIEPTRTWK